MDRFDWIEFAPPAAQGDSADVEEPSVPHDAASFYHTARKMRHSGHFNAAANLYEKALRFEEHHYPAWVELIDTLVRANRIDYADEKSVEAVETYKLVRVLYASRALVLAHRGAFDEALQFSDISLEGDKRYWYAMCVRAEILLKSEPDERHRVLDLLSDAIDAADEAWEPYYLGGTMLLDAGFPTMAASFFAEAGHFNPGAPGVWLCLGDSFKELKLYDQAKFYYQRVIELESSNELAIERQKECGGLIYGLMRVFRRDSLRRRWNNKLEKLKEKWESNVDDV